MQNVGRALENLALVPATPELTGGARKPFGGSPRRRPRLGVDEVDDALSGSPDGRQSPASSAAAP